MFVTMTAKFESVCRRCKAAGVPEPANKIKVGQKFRYGRTPTMKVGVGYHLKAECPAAVNGAEANEG